MYGGGRPQGSPGGGGLGGGGGGGGEPAWLGTAFFAAIILSFIPGPWQIILGPIISVINMFYMFKFGIFFLGIFAVFGLQWWIGFTTMEGQCPNCGQYVTGSKSDPFGCMFCGEELEAKDGNFVRYIKSGKAQNSPFDQVVDFAKEAATKAKEKRTTTVENPGVGARAATNAGKPGPKKDAEVVDVEVL